MAGNLRVAVFVPKEIRWIFYAALLSAILIKVIGLSQMHGEAQRREQRAEDFKKKIQGTALQAQLRKDNVFGHGAEARVLDCTSHVAWKEEPQWDYLCFMYWGTAPGVRESVHQMKFGVMVDSSHVTRMSALVPKDAPEPPLGDARGSQ